MTPEIETLQQRKAEVGAEYSKGKVYADLERKIQQLIWAATRPAGSLF